MVCLDGFFLSHLYEPVDIPTEDQATEFLPPKTVSYPILDTKDPKLLNVLVPPEYYAEFEYDKHQSMLRGLDVVEEVYADFEKQIGRKYESLEAEELHDAEYVLICMGSMSGAVRSVVRELRSLGHRVGMVKVRVFRPFPTRQLSELLRNAKAVGILDRDISFGSSGVLYQEVVRCLYGTPTAPTLINYVVGLGGRDINPSTIHKAFTDLEERSQNHPLNNGTIENSPVWLDLNLSLIESWDLEK
jgi:pyruvate ferredoxin oxidoreductase alpha subunit